MGYIPLVKVMENNVSEFLDSHGHFSSDAEISLEGIFDFFSKGAGKPEIKLNASGVATLQKTYLNDQWLATRKFNTGSVKISGYSTWVDKDPKRAFDVFHKAFDANAKANVSRLNAFVAKLVPFNKFIKDSPDDANPGLVKQAEKLAVVELTNLAYPDGSSGKMLPALTAAGVKEVCGVIVELIKNKTKVTTSVRSLIEELQTTWYGANSTQREKLKLDSDADLIARSIYGCLDAMTAELEYDELDQDGFDQFKQGFVLDLLSWVKHSVK